MNGYTIYLLHIDPPYRHARHYMGICRNGRNLAHRWLEHMNREGSVLTRHARRAGSQLILTRVWLNAPFAMERRLKGRSAAPLCPICQRKSRMSTAALDLPTGPTNLDALLSQDGIP